MAIVKDIYQNKIKKCRVHVDDSMAEDRIAQAIIDVLESYGVSYEDPIILLCVGTDRSTGDCLGPLVGTQLSNVHQENFIFYGTLDQPVHAGNLRDYLDEIHTKYNNPFIIALDACLGSLDSVGYITISSGSLQPGAGVNKSLPKVGDMYITGIVNVGGFMEYLVLQNTRLNLVMKMANTIVGGLCKVAKENNVDLVNNI